MVFEVKDKVALVTGASSGLGYCIAKTLLKQGLKGIALVDIDGSKGEAAQVEFTHEFGEKSCIFRKTDVSNEVQMEDAFRETTATFKQLDIVINNAAVISELNWKKCLDINLGGCLTGTKLAIDKYLPQYKSGSDGVVINISSVVGLQPLGVTPIYSITKQGIVALGRTYGLKGHYDSTNVRVLTVCPGHMKTRMVLEPQLDSFNLEYLFRFPISLSEFPIQEPDFVADSLLGIMEKGVSGSVWVVEDTKPPYEVEFKDRFSMRKN